MSQKHQKIEKTESKKIIENYIKTDDVKLLTKEEEIELAKQIKEGNLKAREEMIKRNMRLAISMAKSSHTKNKKLSFQDLIQESSIGLIKAVDRFDYKKGYKFSTYASWWIKKSIQEYISLNSKVIKIPKSSNLILYKIETFKNDYKNEFGVIPTDKEVASFMSMSEDRIKKIANAISSQNTGSNDLQIVKKETSLNQLSTIENIQDPSLQPDEALFRMQMSTVVSNALNKLSPRESTILKMRFGFEVTEKEIENAAKNKKQSR